MPTYRDLPNREKELITRIFQPISFCFVTTEPIRSPTFYFAKGGLPNLQTAVLCGRIRTMHGDGPLIDVTQSSKRHFFFASRTVRNQIKGFSDDLTRDQLDDGFASSFFEVVGQHYGTVPQANHLHFEYTVPAGGPNRVTRRHWSGGTVVVGLMLTRDIVVRLVDRVLDDGAAIKIDGVEVVARSPSMQRLAIVNPTAYIASL
ncbi:MAG: hypothetical protein ACK5YI_05590 [Rhodospirillales bacterium]|jgi:hypothetical protein